MKPSQLATKRFAAVLAVSGAVHAATPATSPESPYDRRVSAVQVRPDWLAPTALPLKRGDLLGPGNLSAALNAVKESIGARADLYGRAVGTSLITVTYVEPEFVLGDRNDVAVTLRPFYLALPIDSMGRLALPFPRELPMGGRGAAKVLPVGLGLTRDRTIGLAADASLKLGFGGNASRADPFSVRLSGQQSLENSFHFGDARFGAEHANGSGMVRRLFADGEASLARQPRGGGRERMSAAGVRTGVVLAPLRRSRLLLDAAYRRREDLFEDAIRGATEESAHEFATRIQFERIPQSLGFVRAAVWHDLQRSRGASTQRLSGRVGYAREWLLRPNQGIGFEVVAGAGTLWGVSPDWRRFYGGTSAGNFLYDDAGSSALRTMPTGPLLRSFGRAQAGLTGPSGTARGGTRFHHVNINLSLPIPRWSRPLIPDESVGIPGPDGRELTLKDMLRNQVDRTGPNMLAASLAAADRLEPAEAQRRASDIFADIQPAAHYIIDRANVFAVRPLLLFDVATLDSGPQSESWTAAGAGVQLIVVTAKLEAAYMRTLSGTSRSNYNVIIQLGFERLF